MRQRRGGRGGAGLGNSAEERAKERLRDQARDRIYAQTLAFEKQARRSGRVVGDDAGLSAWQSRIVRGIDWLTLGTACVALILLLAKGLLKMRSIGSLILDANFIAGFMIVMYTFLTGFKFTLIGRRQMGFYMVLFSLVVAMVAFVLIRAGLYVIGR